MIKTDVCILGAGPAGASAALHLSYKGVPTVLVDKAVFPRDKVCGDALSGKVPLLLKRLDPQMLARFEQRTEMLVDVWGIRFVAPNRTTLDIPFKLKYDKTKETSPGYVAKRIDFDNFLIDEVKRREDIDFYDNTAIEFHEKIDGGFIVSDKKKDFQVECKLLVIADGAHSKFARHYAGIEKDNAHHAGALRAYYTGVTGFHEDNFIELQFLDEIIPGYFWVFPLPNGQANVGIGMRTDFISKRRVNLKKVMLDVIENHPEIAPRFKNAKLQDKIVGYGLPLGSKKQKLSGDNYMLTGDAGHLIDPLTGEGIGNGFYSGWIAAEQAVECLAQNDYSAKFMKAYDKRIHRVLGTEMKLSYQIQRLMRYPWIINPLSNWVHRNPRFFDIMSRMYNDLELRKQIVNPIFWVKLVLGRKV
jgi:geranylgeranyl reductase family protein